MHRDTRKDMIRLSILALGATALLAGSSSSRHIDDLSIDRARGSEDPSIYLIKRHGDEEHEDEEPMSGMDMPSEHLLHPSHSMVDSTSLSRPVAATATATTPSSSSSIPKASHKAMENIPHGHTHGHTHGHEHHQAYIPDPLLQSTNTFIPIPALPPGAGGHSHGGHGQPKLELNETVILKGKGPDPLSYIEWDFAYGIGKIEDLLRFSQAIKSSTDGKVMGVDGNRWRTLVDERDTSQRLSIASDILQRAQDDPQDPGRHRSLLMLHVIGCILSCFVLLPLALALRAANSSFAPLASTFYLFTFAASLFVSTLYKAMTPRLYPTNSHSGLGYAVFWMSLLALGGDIFKLIMTLFQSIRLAQKSSQKVTLKTIFEAVTFSTANRRSNHLDSSYDAREEERILSDQDNDSDSHQGRDQNSSDSSSQQSHRVHFAQDLPRGQVERGWSHASSSRQGSGDLPSPTSTLCNNTPRTSLFGDSLQYIQNHPSKSGNDERVSQWRQFDEEDEIAQEKEKESKTKRQKMVKMLEIIHVVVARSIPVISFAAAYTGLAVYTGSCRGPYKNVCLAHGIKGGIFFWYGLLSFSRYLGAYADLGWAWNRQPTASKSKKSSSTVSAEWVECFVIFFYGASNTWMERFGAKSGDPFTVKQIQHISIAIMFWFAGLMGLILETKSFRNLLALPVALKQSNINEATHSTTSNHLTCEEAIALPAKPPSYNFSFNPFPALVIGVTGVAMAAHHQDYVYEVSIHSLWGNLLAGFSFFRIMTYFFLWLRPPTSSILPSRPPTEALASFSLTCGGLVFMLSSEEVSFAAMRNGFGDMMMILNVTVAIVSLFFCGIAVLMIIKALAIRYEKRKMDEAMAIRLEEVHHHHHHHHHGHHQQGHTTLNDAATSAVFVLEDEVERTSHQQEDEKRQMSSSPLKM